MLEEWFIDVPVECDRCCHKTRLKGAPCPIGWKCPYDPKEDVRGETKDVT